MTDLFQDIMKILSVFYVFLALYMDRMTGELSFHMRNNARFSSGFHFCRSYFSTLCILE